MLKLYYSRGSSALAAHILLEETGKPYEVEEISIQKQQHQAATFLAVNPKGRIPALWTPHGPLSENPAILEYIAASSPDAGHIPDGLYKQAQARSLCAYICATAHVAYAHRHRGARWTDSAQAIKTMQQRVPANLADCAAYLETVLEDGPWAIAGRYSFCDPYLFLMSKWMADCDLNLQVYPKLASHTAAMRARPATQHVLAVHGLN